MPPFRTRDFAGSDAPADEASASSDAPASDSSAVAEEAPPAPPRTHTYRHTRCGQLTTLPSDVTEGLQAGSHKPEGAKLYCAGCVAQVPANELLWIDTLEVVFTAPAEPAAE